MSAPAKKTVELFYDVISPYAWIGFEVLCRARQTWNIDLQLRPTFSLGIFAGADNPPAALNPTKFAYIGRDAKRVADYYQIPLKHPKDPHGNLFKKGTLQAMRYLTAVDLHHPDLTEAISRELWLRTWSKDLDVAKPESLTEVGHKAGLADGDIRVLLRRITETDVKDKLKATTQAALDYGAFGIPIIVAQDANGKKHMLFGSDRFHILAHILGEREQGPMLEFAHPKLRL